MYSKINSTIKICILDKMSWTHKFMAHKRAITYFEIKIKIIINSSLFQVFQDRPEDWML